MGFPIQRSPDRRLFGTSPKLIAAISRLSSLPKAKASTIHPYVPARNAVHRCTLSVFVVSVAGRKDPSAVRSYLTATDDTCSPPARRARGRFDLPAVETGRNFGVCGCQWPRVLSSGRQKMPRVAAGSLKRMSVCYDSVCLLQLVNTWPLFYTFQN